MRTAFVLVKLQEKMKGAWALEHPLASEMWKLPEAQLALEHAFSVTLPVRLKGMMQVATNSWTVCEQLGGASNGSNCHVPSEGGKMCNNNAVSGRGVTGIFFAGACVYANSDETPIEEYVDDGDLL